MMVLKGLTWNQHWHTDTIAALSDLFSVMNEDVIIEWNYRSLKDYNKELIKANENSYDLVLFKNKHVDPIVSMKTITPLDKIVDESKLLLLKDRSIGNSRRCYSRGNMQYGIPVTVTSLVCAYRADLMEVHNLILPKLWKDVIPFAQKLNKNQKIMMSMKPDNIYGIYRIYLGDLKRNSQGADEETPLFTQGDIEESLDFLKSMLHVLDDSCFEMSMLDIYTRMSSGDDIVYVPAIIGNANYSKDGYRKNLIDFNHIPLGLSGKPESISYSSGLGITSETHNMELASKFIELVMSTEVQDNMIVDFDGHPLYSEAWDDRDNNLKTNGYFENTKESVYDSYNLQEKKWAEEKGMIIGRILWQYLRYGSFSRRDVVEKLYLLMNDYERDIMWI